MRKCKQCSKEVFFSAGSNMGIYCSNLCQQDWQYDNKIKPRVVLGLVEQRTTLKRYLTREQGYHCFECGISEWKGHVLSLELDHIDGDASNNLPVNLRLLCPNCHSITPTWKGRNRGNGRAARNLNLE